MPFDQAPQIETARGPEWELPAITDVRIGRARYEPRPTRNFPNPIGVVEDAIEVVVSLDKPMPIRAMAPVLWVGDERLTESEAVGSDGKQLRFWSFHPAGLRAGAPIAMAWMTDDRPKGQQQPAFTYKQPE